MQLPWRSWGSCCIWKCVEAVVVWIKWRSAIAACTFSDSGTASVQTRSTLHPWRGMFLFVIFFLECQLSYCYNTYNRLHWIHDSEMLKSYKFPLYIHWWRPTKDLRIWVVDACLAHNISWTNSFFFFPLCILCMPILTKKDVCLNVCIFL